MCLVTPIENKEAEMVAKAIIFEWLCKFGLPAQIHTVGEKLPLYNHFHGTPLWRYTSPICP
jgi:hypothetical protein